MDLLQHFLFSTPYGRTLRSHVFALPLPKQILVAWIGAFQAGMALAWLYPVGAVIAVCLGISQPQEWPPIFGSFSKGYTMRKIWGYCWHQNLRRMFTRVTSAATHILGIQKGSLLSRYIQLYGAFIISAGIHHVGALNVPYHPAVWSQLFFFLLQPVAITVEDIVIYLGSSYFGIKESGQFHHIYLNVGPCRANSPTVATRAVGFLWVFCFLSWSLRYMVAMTSMIGDGGQHPLIWSIADRVL
jgi:Membrane bound O-acyl transferase family